MFFFLVKFGVFSLLYLVLLEVDIAQVQYGRQDSKDG